MRKATVSAFLLALSACAITPEKVPTYSDGYICQAYGTLRDSALSEGEAKLLKAEMLKRKLLTDEEWRLVDQSHVSVGMSACGALASWGAPSVTNESTYADGKHFQLVYRGVGLAAQYVYIINGKVTGIQSTGY